MTQEAHQDKAASPWEWRADLDEWFEAVNPLASAWEPKVDLTSDRSVGDVLVEAAGHMERWLYHPCIAAVTHGRDDGREARDTALIGWIGAHTGLVGEVAIAEPLWCWTGAGGTLVEPGLYGLNTLGSRIAEAEPKLDISFDPWCSVLGYTYPDSVPASGMSDAEQRAEVRRSTLVALNGLAVLEAYLPEVLDWLTSLTQVVICLDGSDGVSRSASASDLPGIVFADALSEIAFMEVAVHEAAHHLVYLSEAGGPLVDPNETRLFESPLRTDPRPLRGIILAYHALAYMCALYRDVTRSDLGATVIDHADFAELRKKMYLAGGTIERATASLTDRGQAFLARAKQVVAYVG